jgi:hypothetical protein
MTFHFLDTIFLLLSSTLSHNLVGKISAHFKNTPLYIIFYKMWQNFTYEVVGQRRRLKAINKNCTSKIKCHFIF